MKKSLFCVIFIIFLVSLSSCDLSYLSSGKEALDHKSIEVTEGVYVNVCKKYNIVENTNLYVIENYNDYVKFCSDANLVIDDILDEESYDKFFSKNVKVVNGRVAKDSLTEASCAYGYDNSLRKIVGVYGFYVEDDRHKGKIEYNFDIIDVSRRMYKKMTK